MTEHDLALKEKQEYNDFIDALALVEVPASLHRWYNEAVLEKFECDFEEILYYGEEE